MKLLDLLLKLGILVEGAPKGSYEVELVLAYYKNMSVFKRYYLPFLEKLPENAQVKQELCNCASRCWIIILFTEYI